MTYQEALDFLDSFQNYEKSIAYQYPEDFSLDRIKKFLDKLGNPHREYQILHVAGTKGKGSTCVFAASILQRTGARVGLYTSPHLVCFRERIRIDGQPISEEALADIVAKIKAVVFEDLTYFEVTTAAAFLYFSKEKIDVAVVEVGLGGRLDATNVVEPEVTVITPISLDHRKQLGDTLEAIAREKAGILKPKVPVVIAPQTAEVAKMLERVAFSQSAPIHWLEDETQIQEISVSLEGSRISLQTPVQSYPDLFIPLLGRHQLTNAAMAIRMVELFAQRRKRSPFAPRTIQEGLTHTVWPGRCQRVKGTPAILLDGAHNSASVLVLKETVEELFPGRPIILVVGISQDKDIEGMASLLGPWAKQTILTRSLNPRAESPERLAHAFRPWQSHPQIAASVTDALQRAQENAHSDDLVVVTGSLFVVGEPLAALGLASDGCPPHVTSRRLPSSF